MADSIVYDTLVEATGSGDGYEKWIGRVQVVEAAALVLSALVGGALAALASARFTYFATVPVVAAAALAFRHSVMSPDCIARLRGSAIAARPLPLCVR